MSSLKTNSPIMRRQSKADEAKRLTRRQRLGKLEEEERQLIDALAVRYDEQTSRLLREVEIEITRITGEKTMDTGFNY